VIALRRFDVVKPVLDRVVRISLLVAKHACGKSKRRS
jgi:hypothetical protein